MKTRVAIVDDHSVFRNGIIQVLSKNDNIEVIFEANNGKECLDWLSSPEKIPDILLLDIQMPVMNGFDTLDYLHLHYTSVKVIMLSLIQDQISVNNFLQRGAAGFIAKNAEPEDILDVIEKTINENSQSKSNHVIVFGKGYFNSDQPVELTQREYELIKYSATGYTYQQIASILSLTPKVLDHLRASLFKKLNIQSRQELASIAVRMGLADQSS